jgi:hypothetical protein
MNVWVALSLDVGHTASREWRMSKLYQDFFVRSVSICTRS